MTGTGLVAGSKTAFSIANSFHLAVYNDVSAGLKKLKLKGDCINIHWSSPGEVLGTNLMASITVEKAFKLINLVGKEIAREREEEEERNQDPSFRDKKANDKFGAKSDRTVLGYMKDPDFDEDRYLDITSHDMQAYFLSKSIIPKEKYPEFFSDVLPRAALTYEWSTTFRTVKAFLNSENIEIHNTSQAVMTDSQSSRVFSGSCVTEEEIFTYHDFAPLRMMLGVLRFFSYYMFCCFGCCGLLASLPTDMANFPIWIDIFFIDQITADPELDLDDTEDAVKETPTHLVIGTETLLTRAWVIFELLMRKEAGLFSQIIRARLPEHEAIRQLQPGPGTSLRDFHAGLKRRNFFEDMVAHNNEDRARIQDRLLRAYGGPQAVNDAVVSVVEGQEGFVPAGGNLRVLQGVVISVLAWVAFPLALLLVLVTLIVWAVSALGKLVRVGVRGAAKPAPPEPGGPAQPGPHYKRIV